jgi:hypothetical protein
MDRALRRDEDKIPGVVAGVKEDDEAPTCSSVLTFVKYRTLEAEDMRRASRALMLASILSLLWGRGHSFNV